MSFDGLCRYGSDDGEWMKMIDVTNVQECQEHCVENETCVAFSYEIYNAESCYLYKGGPYTYGTGRVNTTCYIMKGRPFYLSLIYTNLEEH